MGFSSSFLPRFGGYRLSSLVGDLRGGLAAALVGIPTELIYGLIATAPLGVAYQNSGVIAAFNACIVAAVAAAFGGLHVGQIPGSRSMLALISAALLSDLMTQWPSWFGGAPDPSQLLSVLFVTVILSGILQIGFGVCRLGHLVKFLPAPVLSGITNGVAILMVVQILKPLLGVPRSLPWSDPTALWQASQVLSILIGAMAAYLYVRPPKMFAALPSVFISLTASVAAYYSLHALFGAEHLGLTFGTIPATIPRFIGGELMASPWTAHRLEILRHILPYALTMAALASIESLICAAAVDAIRKTRHVSNRELVAQGLGNVASGLFGGTPVAATMPRTMVNIASGARSSLAAIAYSATVLGLLLLVPGWIGAIPQVATAGILLGVAWQMIDPWSRRTLRTMILGRRRIPSEQWIPIAVNGVIMLSVALSTLVLGLVWALAFGVLLTIVFFLRANQKAVIRSVSTGLDKRSLRVRPLEQTRFLDMLGGDLVVIEAQGPLFFASADHLAREIEDRAADGDVVVLDVARVNYVDATAARVLKRVVTGLRSSNKSFYLSGLNPKDKSRGEIVWMLTDAGHSPAEWFADLDSALEAAEDEMLAVRFDPQDRWRHYGLGESTLGSGLGAEELDILQGYLRENRFGAQDLIYRASEPADSLHVLTQGAVSLYLDVSENKRVRLTAFSAGTVFGALGAFDGKSHPGTAIADVAVQTLELSADGLDRLAAEHPQIAAKVFRNLNAALADRLGHLLDSLRVVVNN